MYHQKVKQKIFFVGSGIFEGHWGIQQDLDSLVRGTDLMIRIRTEMLWIRNAVFFLLIRIRTQLQFQILPYHSVKSDVYIVQYINKFLLQYNQICKRKRTKFSANFWSVPEPHQNWTESKSTYEHFFFIHNDVWIWLIPYYSRIWI